MSRPVMPPIGPRQQTVTEPSAKLGAPGEPAGDAAAIVDQRAASDEKATRRRAKLTQEVKEAAGQSGLDLQDDLVDKATGKTVDDLVK
jgi:hypothetical protein